MDSIKYRYGDSWNVASVTLAHRQQEGRITSYELDWGWWWIGLALTRGLLSSTKDGWSLWMVLECLSPITLQLFWDPGWQRQQPRLQRHKDILTLYVTHTFTWAKLFLYDIHLIDAPTLCLILRFPLNENWIIHTIGSFVQNVDRLIGFWIERGNRNLNVGYEIGSFYILVYQSG